MRNTLLRFSITAIMLTMVSLQATDHTVGPSGDYATIQAAVTAATSGDRILLEAGQTFTGAGNYEITLSKSLTFTRTGSGADPIIELGDHQLFNITSGYTVSINNLNIQNGSSTYGGAISNYGTLTITSCTFNGNRATRGGAIYNINATLTLEECFFTANSCRTGNIAFGGAIYSEEGNLNITRFC